MKSNASGTEVMVVDNRPSLARLRPWLLACGAVAPPLQTFIFTVLGAVQPGYSPIRDFDSDLSYGAYGWIQILNFILYGLLMLAFAAGIRGTLVEGRASVAGPILFAIIGVLLIAVGVFVADPGCCAKTVHGALHIDSAILAYVCSVAACFVFARRFARDGERGFAWYGRATGLAIAIVFVLNTPLTPGLGPGWWPGSLGINGLLQRVGLAFIYLWTLLLALRLLNYGRRTP